MSTGSGSVIPPIIAGLFALLGVLITSFTTLVVAGIIDPSFVRLDFIFPQQVIHITDDFVFVKLTGFADRRKQPPIGFTEKGEPIYDRATYVENVRLRKSKNASYKIHLESTGILPRVLAISPDIAVPKYSEANGLQMMDADLELSQNAQFATSKTIEDIKMLYEFRNGYQPPDNSYGGKVIKYPTDHLTLVFDFSAVITQMSDAPPTAQIEEVNAVPEPLHQMEWENGIASVSVFNLQPGRKVKLYWKWRELP